MAKQKKAKSFVYYDTIWKGVGGGLSNPGESRLCKVGKHKVLLTRSERLNRYGNPVHIPIKETDPQNPINPYGESKLMMEKISLPPCESISFFLSVSVTAPLSKISSRR